MKATIGLEIHVQLNTASKLFCDCSADYSTAEPNSNLCPICSGQVGAKPMLLNKEAVKKAYAVAKILGCNLVYDGVVVQRKHYFYPDLPSGYQRTSKPIGIKGKLDDVEIWEVHLEEDPGRYELRKGLVDYNRSGVPLVEIVSAPVLKSPEHARTFLKKLEHALTYFNLIKDEVGSMRIDANISLENGARVEIKNINSFSNVYDALRFEIKRQENLLRQGFKVERETRHFDEESGTTIRLRKKETADDYRYMPDPDIIPFSPLPEMMEEIEKEISELPWDRAERFVKDYGLDEKSALVLVEEKAFADLFEELAKEFSPVPLCNWLKGPFKKQLNYRNLSVASSPLNYEGIKELYSAFYSGAITDDGMEAVLIKMLDDRRNDAGKIIEELGLRKIESEEELKKFVEEVIKENPTVVEEIKKGNNKSLNYLVGMVMKKSKGKADPKITYNLIKEQLNK